MTLSNPLLNTEAILFNTFQLGMEAEEFLKSKVGDYVLERAKSDLSDAVDVFINLPAQTNMEKITEAQLKAQAAIKTVQWLVDAIEDGNMSEIQLKELDDQQN